MAKFITSNELNSELEKLFESAEELLILISPYIKLHERYASALSLKKDNPNLQIIVVFGKNEDDLSRSMSIDDLTFFTQFPNIQIRYEKRLHAKYYSNERFAILTSMNLHKFSQDNNIESGILTRPTLLSRISKGLNKKITGDNLDDEALTYFNRVVDQAELIFEKEPQYDKGILGTGLKKKYTHSKITNDTINEAFKNINNDYGNVFTEKVVRMEKQQPSMGFCIRTGKPIPFNLSMPLCEESFRVWNSFGNMEYQENYCHFSGEPSNGETTFARPILYKNWAKARDMFGEKMNSGF